MKRCIIFLFGFVYDSLFFIFFLKSYKGPKNNSSSALKSNIGSSQIIGSNTKLSSRQNSPFSNRSNDAFDGPTIPYKIKIRTGKYKFDD